MTGKHLRSTTCGAAAAALLASWSAEAQIAGPMSVPDLTQPEAAPETQSVFQRGAPPGYEALDLRLGSFVVGTELDVDEGFNSNLYATDSHVRSDVVTTIAPRLAIASDWSNHAVSLVVEGDIDRYLKNSSENVENLAVAADGRLDIRTGEYLSVGGGYQSLHEDRSSPDDNLGRFPTAYTVAGGRLGYVLSRSRLSFGIDADLSRYDYSDEPVANGPEIVNKDRNRTEYSLTPRLAYEMLPGYQAYVELSGNDRVYDRKVDRSGLQRNSAGGSAAVGIEAGTGHIITGRIYVGYQQQDYADPRLDTFRAPYFGAAVLWNVTQLTSFRFGLADSVAETILPGASGAQQTTLSASFEHELERNLLLSGGVGLERDAYQGTARTDDVYSATASAERLINRVFSVKLTGSWSQRSSTVAGAGYDRESLMLTLKIRL
jgi:hypothetical protein